MPCNLQAQMACSVGTPLLLITLVNFAERRCNFNSEFKITVGQKTDVRATLIFKPFSFHHVDNEGAVWLWNTYQFDCIFERELHFRPNDTYWLRTRSNAADLSIGWHVAKRAIKGEITTSRIILPLYNIVLWPTIYNFHIYSVACWHLRITISRMPFVWILLHHAF